MTTFFKKAGIAKRDKKIENKLNFCFRNMRSITKLVWLYSRFKIKCDFSEK